MTTPRTYLKVSTATWELIRAAYLSGLSGAVVARRFGVTQSALRKRASREGWTKAAHAKALEPVSRHPRPPTPRRIEMDPDSMARAALTEAMRAMLDGKPHAARAIASAGEAMVRLAHRAPNFILAEDVYDEEEGQPKWFDLAIESAALNLAHQLTAGQPLSPHFAKLEEEWRAHQAEAARSSPVEQRETGEGDRLQGGGGGEGWQGARK